MVVQLQRFLNGTDGVDETSVAHTAVLRGDGAGLSADESLFLQSGHILPHGVFAQLHRPADGTVAGMTLVGVAVLTPEQVGVDRNFFGVQIKTEDLVGHFEIALVGIAFGPALEHQFSPPVCCSTHRRNLSLAALREPQALPRLQASVH